MDDVQTRTHAKLRDLYDMPEIDSITVTESNDTSHMQPFLLSMLMVGVIVTFFMKFISLH